MEEIEIDCYMLAEADDIELKARWYGGAMVNIYYQDKEVDVYNDYGLHSKDDFIKSFERYVQYQLQENEGEHEENS